MQTSDAMVRESMIRSSPGHATAFRCAICGGTDLEVQLGNYENPLMVRISCRTCPNYRDWILMSETE